MNTNNSISRRSALKRMGAVLLGGVAAATGLSSLAACGTPEKKRLILYFTGTGNCLYVARQLAGEGGEVVSIPQLVKRGQYELDADEIGLVYPVYGHMPPYMVRQFLLKAKLNADYRFAVLTYGARKCDAVEILDRILEQAGTPFHFVGTLLMVDNWLPNFDMNEQMKMEKHIPENLAKLEADINARRQWHEPVSQLEREQHQGFMQRSGLDPEVGFLMKCEKHFRVTPDCIGCGICTDVCPRGNYSLGSQGVALSGDCEFCFACIQNCPQKAIQFAEVEPGTFPDGTEKNPKARFRNEHVSLMDIKRANSQKG
ncbi:MAG: EFR1 family ferrodoxin [Bacteroidales bacterium]|nr:EFR1 family ferrodoxin [Bacteroidales bacterium]